MLAQLEQLLGVAPRSRREPAGGAVGEALDDEPPQRGGECPQRRQFDRARPAEHLVDERVEHVGLVAQDREQREDIALRRRMDSPQGRHQAVPDAIAGERVELVALVLAPRETALDAVRRRLLAGERQQRADQRAFASAHPEQRAAARRGRDAIEDRLDLVAGGVPGGDVGTPLDRQLRRGSVARVARPGLEIARPRPPRPLDGKLDAERGAQLGAVALVLVGRVAEPVVDVQRANRAAPSDPDGHVEQAARVAPARIEDDHAAPGGEQPALADPLDHTTSTPVDHDSSSPARAMKISVASRNPFSFTSAIRSNSRWGPACSTTGRVTSTSPPAERAATREAMLMSRP